MTLGMRDKTLIKKRYQDALIVESDFPNVAYEIRGRALNIMHWNDRNALQQIAGTFTQMKQFAAEVLMLIEAWEDV